jgi:hypothetical protein
MLRWLTVLGALVAGACVRTSDFPWDAKQLADDVSKEVRFEGVTRPLLQVEPLGWRIDEGACARAEAAAAPVWTATAPAGTSEAANRHRADLGASG